MGVGDAVADVFRLQSGGTISGQLLRTENGNYEIRAVVGVVRVPVDAVESIEEATTPFEEYKTRAEQTADTAEAQTLLAEWCEEQDLRAEQQRHLGRALELQPDYAPARRGLGYVRVGDWWVNGRRTMRREQPPEKAAGGGVNDEERVARAIQGQWNLRIRAIRRALLESRDDRRFREGRGKILEIKDPLVILPLSEVLSQGSVACRLTLVEALSGFGEDEATMNLAILALIDASEDVREKALVEVDRREDPRAIAQYRSALSAGNDVILRRAAYALGKLKAQEAVPELINMLTARRTKWIEVPVHRYFRRWPRVFTGTTTVGIGSKMRVGCAPRVGVWNPRCRIVPDVKNEWRLRSVTVYRTEVLEALKRITRQNFGFERDQWLRWYEEFQP